MAKLIDIFAENHPESFVEFVTELGKMNLLEIPENKS